MQQRKIVQKHSRFASPGCRIVNKPPNVAQNNNFFVKVVKFRQIWSHCNAYSPLQFVIVILVVVPVVNSGVEVVDSDSCHFTSTLSLSPYRANTNKVANCIFQQLKITFDFFRLIPPSCCWCYKTFY